MRKCLSLLLAFLLPVIAAGAMAEEAPETLENPVLTDWSMTFTALQLVFMGKGLPVEFSADTGIISYYEKNVRTGSGGERVADGGTYSENRSYMLGMGAGVEREDLWYITMTYDAGTDMETCYNNTACMLLAFNDIKALWDGGEDEHALAEAILDRLVNQPGSVGIQYGGKVFIRIDRGSRFIVGVDSLEFYEAFYADSLEEYYSFDET